MSRRQHVFTAEGLDAEPRELMERDRDIMRRWRVIKAQCPWCLHVSDLWAFATFIMKRKGQTVSETNCVCPECNVAVKRKTLIRIYEMTMADYGRWFWDQVFSGAHDKVSWTPLKKRLNQGFNYRDRQPFWDEYWAHKELSLGGWESDEDEEYEDYVAHAEAGEPP